MGQLIGDKMYECSQALDKTSNIISNLQKEVEFPNIRSLVNDGKIDLKEIFRIRKRARKFRAWLQNESERDHNAIFAYHHEVTKELGYVKGTRKVLSLFGVLGSGATGSVIGSVLAGPAGAAIGGAAGSATGYVLDVASKIGAGWKPVVFGNWLKERIEKIVHSR